MQRDQNSLPLLCVSPHNAEAFVGCETLHVLNLKHVLTPASALGQPGLKQGARRMAGHAVSWKMDAPNPTRDLTPTAPRFPAQCSGVTAWKPDLPSVPTHSQLLWLAAASPCITSSLAPNRWLSPFIMAGSSSSSSPEGRSPMPAAEGGAWGVFSLLHRKTGS